jgi:hypothetical protein
MKCIGGVMVSAIDLGFETDGVKPMIIKLEITASPPRLISWQQVNFQWNDNEVRIVLDQHA